MATSRYGNYIGRPKGALNYTTREARLFAARVVNDPEYRENVLQRARAGQLGSFETTLWAYAAGRPPSDVTLHLAPPEEEDLSQLSLEELAERAKELAEQCRAEARPIRGLLPPASAVGFAQESDGQDIIADSIAQQNSCSSNELGEASNNSLTASSVEEAALRAALVALLAEDAQAVPASDEAINFPTNSEVKKS